MQSNTRSKPVFFNKKRGRVNKIVPKEDSIYTAVALHMKTCYPDVIYRFDFASGTVLSWKQAKRHKELQKERAFPDFMIYKKCGFYVTGLALEIKREGTRVIKRDGSLVSDEHIQEQNEVLKKLIAEGWATRFTIGLKDTIDTIDEYMFLCGVKSKVKIKY